MMLMPENRILAIDDNAAFLADLKAALAGDTDLKIAADLPTAMKTLLQSSVDLVLLDMNMPEVSGMEFLKVLRQRSPMLPIIMLTGESKPETIIEAMKNGASDYVIKGTEDFIPSLRLRIHQALQLNGVRRQNKILSEKIKATSARYEILGISPASVKLRSEITRYKGTDAYVLIQGENGTGKELIARNLNLQENDPSRPFVAVNCAAIPSTLFESELFGHVKGAFTGATHDQEGKFVAANGGDLFLDEIGELPPEMQVKLLRILQEKVVTPVGSAKQKPVDVRVIAATNRKLDDLVRDGKFRTDLYFRLNQIVIHTVPLRARREDIIFLAEIFAGKFLPGVVLSKEAKIMLEAHSWPGNIRELQNTIERACILVRGSGKAKIFPEHLMVSDLVAGSGEIHIPSGLIPNQPQDVTKERFQECFHWLEKLFLERSLEILHGDNGALIDRIGVSKSHYYRRKKALGLLEEKEAWLA